MTAPKIVEMVVAQEPHDDGPPHYGAPHFHAAIKLNRTFKAAGAVSELSEPTP